LKIAVQTLGCKVNQSESSSIEASLLENGHEVVGHGESPDICVINTCTVTAKSDYQSRQLIRRAVRAGACVIATGCYAQLRPEEISKIRGVGLVIGNSHKDRLLEYIGNLGSNGGRPQVLAESPDAPLVSKPYRSDRVRAFLKIQDGCNRSCSYCAVPLARGKSRSLDPAEVISGFRKLVESGYQEVVLTGVHIGTYGADLKTGLSLYDIVKGLIREFPGIRIRLSSIEPNEVDDRFLDLISDGALCPHLHVPLQSGADALLKKMRRGYVTSQFRRLVERILTRCPDISIGTDIIIGFPGESEDYFNQTMEFIDTVPFSYAHVFPYSRRPGTDADSFPGHVNNMLKRERMRKALKLAQAKKYAFISRQIGHKLDVIVEANSATSDYFRTISSNYLRPLVREKSLLRGQRLPVLAVSMDKGELICKSISEIF
jgi:threonylcarbamoyladenosine tRNA methylthiotransferase MtaB